MSLLRRGCVSLVLSFVLFFFSRVANSASITAIGDLPGGTFSSTATGVSNTGIVVGTGNSATGQEAFVWSAAGGMVPLGMMPGFTSSRGGDISADGTTVTAWSVVGNNPVIFEPFIWTSGGGREGLGAYPSHWFPEIDAAGISADGTVIVGTAQKLAGGTEAYYWTRETGYVPIGDLPGGDERSGATAVAKVGSEIIVVGSGRDTSPGVGPKPFIWTSSTGMNKVPGTTTGEIRDISSDGSAIVGGGTPFVSINGVFTRFNSSLIDGPLGFQGFNTAVAVSDYGQRVVGNGDYYQQSSQNGFVYEADGGMQRLHNVLVSLNVDMTGWSNLSISDMSPNGRYIIGRGTRDGVSEAFLVDLPEGLVAVPEPSSVTLALVGVFGVVLAVSRLSGRISRIGRSGTR